MIRNTLMLAILDVGAPLPDYLYATDAQGANDHDDGGYAIVKTTMSSEVALDVWRSGVHPHKTVVKLDGDTSCLRKPVSKLEARIPVSCVPRHLIDGSSTLWQLLHAGRWRFADRIELGEARATIKLLRLLAVFPGSFRRKIASLQDNSSWGCAAHKGRSPIPALNFLIRQKSALCLAKRWALWLPWVQSADQPADEGSRTVGVGTERQHLFG